MSYTSRPLSPTERPEDRPALKVGAERDWSLDIYPAIWRTGETGLHLRFRRVKDTLEQKFIMFLGADETRELLVELVLSLEELSTTLEPSRPETDVAP